MPAYGRRVPVDFDHVIKYPFAVSAPATVEKVLPLPAWHWKHDQGQQGSCVGHGTAMERAITNTAQNRLLRLVKPSVRYSPLDIWNEAKKIDEWPETNPGDSEGTSVRAAYDVLRSRGACVVRSMRLAGDTPEPVGLCPPSAKHGISANRWARKVDEMRASIARGIPVSIGVNWYQGFNAPALELRGKDYWIGEQALSSAMDGGHCVCIYGASDRRQAFRLKNSWGKSYPLVWLPYSVMELLLAQDGEASLVTDR